MVSLFRVRKDFKSINLKVLIYFKVLIYVISERFNYIVV